MLGEPDPVATGRTGDLAGARSRAEGALHAYTDADELSGRAHYADRHEGDSTRFVADSPVEETGFEPSVPRQIRSRFESSPPPMTV